MYDRKHAHVHVSDSSPKGYCAVEFFADGTAAAECFPRGDGAEVVTDAWLGAFLAEQRG